MRQPRHHPGRPNRVDFNEITPTHGYKQLNMDITGCSGYNRQVWNKMGLGAHPGTESHNKTYKDQ